MATIYDNLIQKTPSSGGSIPTKKGTIYDSLLSKNKTPLSKPTIYDKLKADIKPPFYTKITEPVKKYVGDFTSSINDQTANKISNAMIHPFQTAQKVSDIFLKGYMGGIEKAGAGLANVVGEKKYTAKTAAGLFDVGTGLISAVISPITGFFEVAQKIPGVKQVADFVSLPFTIPAKVTDYGVGKIIDTIPESIMSQETKDIIKKPLQDITSSIAAIYFGGKIMKAIEGYSSRGKKITTQDAQKIVSDTKDSIIKEQTVNIKGKEYTLDEIHNKVPTEMLEKLSFEERAKVRAFDNINSLKLQLENLKKRPNPELYKEDIKFIQDTINKEEGNLVKTSVEKHTEYAKSQGYEPYISPTQLPIIPFGKKGKEALPTIDYETGKITKPLVAKGEIAPTYENFVKETQTKVPQESRIVSEPVNVPIESIKTGPETRPTQLSETLQIDAFNKGIEADFGKSPEYQTMNMKDQLDKANNIIKNSPEFAKNIIEGNVPPPEGVKLGSVYTAMKLDALERGDVAKVLELSKSKVNEIASSYGQEVKAFDSQLASDPIKIINDVQKIRETQSEKRTQTTKVKAQEKVVDEIKKEVKAKAPTKEDWSSFIRDIQCP